MPDESYVDFAKYVSKVVRTNFKTIEDNDATEAFAVKIFVQNLARDRVRDNLYRQLCLFRHEERPIKLAEFVELAQVEHNAMGSGDLSPATVSAISSLISKQSADEQRAASIVSIGASTADTRIHSPQPSRIDNQPDRWQNSVRLRDSRNGRPSP